MENLKSPDGNGDILIANPDSEGVLTTLDDFIRSIVVWGKGASSKLTSLDKDSRASLEVY